MRVLIGTAVAVLALAATPAFAKDRTGYQAIAAGDLASAERTLLAERRIFPQRAELMLNLAVVYDRTGRANEARALYRQVLDAPAVSMDMPSGAVISSHTLADAALTRAAASQYVAR